MTTEFINLDEQEIPIFPDYPHSLSNIKPDTKIIDGIIEDDGIGDICAIYDVVTITTMPGSTDEDQLCLREECDVSKYYGCTTSDGGFQKDNLFSELTDEYQRTQARINLGISDEYAMIWGNIKGNLANQKDLYTFVIDSIANDINTVVTELNQKLAQWAYEIEISLKNKADVYSPSFSGLPTTTLPLISDNSNRIASTEWVNAKIEAASLDDNIEYILIDPEYMCYGDSPIDVKLVWEYNKEVEEQSINAIPIKPNIREYLFAGVTTAMIFTLKYKYGEGTGSKVLIFDIRYPIYYGVSPEYTKQTKTIENVFTVDAKTTESIYVMIPNGSSTVLSVNSVIGGFKLLGTQEIHNNTYYIFKSANVGLGETTVEILNLDGFDSNNISATSIRELLATKADQSNIYSKSEIDIKLAAIESGDINLTNYYTKLEIDTLIPDISNKADKTEIPTKASQLYNDTGYITKIPIEYITEQILINKGYLTEEVEPLFLASAAKTINKSDITNWNSKVDKLPGMGLSEQSFTSTEKAKLGGLSNYSDAAVRELISDLDLEIQEKADRTEIPDISNKANKSDIPTKVSQLSNDSGYLNILPSNVITEELLTSKGYITSFTEEDPTVPSWAKTPTKPIYTLEEIGAEAEGSALLMLDEANTYTDTKVGILTQDSDVNYNTFRKVGDAITSTTDKIGIIDTYIQTIQVDLLEKADRSELFSGSYNDLSHTPSIPSIEGLASEVYVNEEIAKIPGVDLSGYALKSDIPIIPDISTKVDKVIGKGLSTNDFTTTFETKLIGLNNYDDTNIQLRLANIESSQNNLKNHISYELFNATNPLEIFEDVITYKKYLEELLKYRIITVEFQKGVFCTSYKMVTSVFISSISITVFFIVDVMQDLKITLSVNITNIPEQSEVAITKIYSSKIVDGIESYSETSSLSSYQGKLLRDKIDRLEELVNDILIPKASIALED